MRIKRLEIYGYGKWVDQTFDLKRDVQLFYGPNEAGKSTLMSFIHSILFGFPTRNSTLLRYEPQESSKYGGKIIAEDDRFGEVIIERVHGKVTGDVIVTLEDGATGTEELLDSVLAGLTRENFQNIFSFSLSDIEDVHQLNKEQLSRYLLNIGAHGTDYYLDLVDDFRKEADKLYRPTGRVLPLNRQLAALEKQEKRLADLETRNESYLGLVETNSRQLNAIDQLEKKREQTEKRLAEIREFKKDWHVYEEIKTLQASVQKTSLPPLKEDGRYLLEEYKKELAKVKTDLKEAQSALDQQKETLEHLDIMEHYESQQTKISQLEQTLPEMVEQLGDYQVVAKQRAENQKILTELERQLRLEQSTAYPTAFSEEEKKQAEQWQFAYAELAEKATLAEKGIQALENKLTLKNQQLDQIESVMWDNETLRKVEQELETKDTPQEQPKSNRRRHPLFTGLLGSLALAGGFYFDAPLQWLLWVMGGILLAGAFFLSFRRSKESSAPAPSSSAFMVQEYEKQMTFKDQWRETLGEVDAIQARYQDQIKTHDGYLNNQKAIRENWQELLERNQLSGALNLSEAQSILAQTNQLQNLLEVDEELLRQYAALKDSLFQQTQPIVEVLALPDHLSFGEKIQRFRTYLTELNHVLKQEESNMQRLTEMREQIKRLSDHKQNLLHKMETLIETAGVPDETAFFALYEQKEALDAKKSRLKFLKENAPAFKAEEELPTKEALEQKEEKLQTTIQKITEENKAALRELANTQLAIEQLEKDGTYAEELQHFENQKATAQRLVDEWVSNKIAAGMIQETLSQVTKDRFEEIIVDAESYFRLLTDAEYERIVFKEEELFVQHKNGQVMDVRVLSRGTAEPLYVAIRLAYIKNTQDMIELPIIMDDPFVNFDHTRQRNMYRLMQQLGRDLQIIYFTFDPTVQDYFTPDQMIDLSAL